ncbi:MAG: flagellar export protein FliJ [Planctomycetota bacterium]|jgi:flagellar biosynthesis chaperone FliJ
MKRFVWRLQRVLEIKTKEEQTKRAELLELTEKLAQTQGELLTRKKILEDILRDITGKNPQKRLGEQEFFLKCSRISDELIKKLKNKVSALESQQREKIAEVLRAKRFKEGLEKLRAEAKRRFIKEQEKLEQKELDEGATISFSRKKDDRLLSIEQSFIN